jgi:hypothetical protein
LDRQEVAGKAAEGDGHAGESAVLTTSP